MTQEDATTELDKINLREFLDSDERLSISEALSIIKKTIICVAEVHNSGQSVKVLDPERLFIHSTGSVSIDTTSPVSEIKVDESGKSTGAIEYASPEFLEKGVGSVASDIYSIGALAFHLVTGNVPFAGESAVQTAKNRMRGDVTELAAQLKECPEDLKSTILKALSKSPQDRYRTVSDLLTDLNLVREIV